MEKTIVLFCILFLCMSCSNEVEDILNNSFWDKRVIYIDGMDALFCFNSPMIYIRKDGTINLLENNSREGCDTLNSPSRKGMWEVYQKEDNYFYMKITSKLSSVFEGEHRLIFYKDTTEKLLYMKLKSKNFYYIGARFLLNYDVNIKKINKLILLTQDSLDPDNQLDDLGI